MALTEINTKSIKDGEVKTADIADSAISLAKIENGTSSDDGKFLKNNDGAAPSWAEVDTSNITVTDEGTDTTCFPVFTTTATGTTGPKTNVNLTYSSNTGVFKSASFQSGNVGGTGFSWIGPGSTSSGTYAGYLDGNGVLLSANVSGPCSIRFCGNTESDYVGFSSIGSSLPSGTQLIWKLPTADGTADQVLKTNGSATLSWGDAGAGATGGGTNKIFWENEKIIDYNYTITNNHNAMTAGPVEIAATGNGDGSAVVVTVGDGETWTIV